MRRPLGLAGGVHDISMAVSFVARALISAGASGTAAWKQTQRKVL